MITATSPTRRTAACEGDATSGATSGIEGVAGARRIPAQVGRATAWTLSVALVGGTVVWAWGAWGCRVMPLWYRAFGDRSISLAAGTVLPSDGCTVAMPEVVTRLVPTSAAIAVTSSLLVLASEVSSAGPVEVSPEWVFLDPAGRVVASVHATR